MKNVNDALLVAAKDCGIGQICHKASILTDDWNKKIRDAGFSVRAWGVDNEGLMKRMLELQVDGMTINFPDVLNQYLAD